MAKGGVDVGRRNSVCLLLQVFSRLQVVGWGWARCESGLRLHSKLSVSMFLQCTCRWRDVAVLEGACARLNCFWRRKQDQVEQWK